MNDLMRPALYGAKHKIIPVNKKNKSSNKIYEFVGPICESTDKFLSVKKFQKLNENELIIICDVGAYGSSLSSNYNLRSKPGEILIKNSRMYQRQNSLKIFIPYLRDKSRFRFLIEKLTELNVNEIHIGMTKNTQNTNYSKPIAIFSIK